MAPPNRILQAVEEHLKSQGSHGLLALLPRADALRWRTIHIKNSNQVVPKALFIGTLHEAEVYACILQHGDKTPEARYYQKAKGSATVVGMTADDVPDAKLIAPFKYIAGTSKSEKRKMSIFIKYYFIARGYLEDDVTGELKEFTKRFHGSLQTVAAGHAAEYGLPEENEEDTYDIRTRSGARQQQLGPRRSTTAAQARTEQPQDDFQKLLDYLEERDALELLENTPPVSEMNFKQQTFILDNAQPEKLLVGTNRKDGGPIYAYMVRGTRRYHEVRFYNERGIPEPMITSTVALQNLVHPFNKCGNSLSITAANFDQGAGARFTLMVKWYFVAAGIVKDVVLRETQAFPYRLKAALEHIEIMVNKSRQQQSEENENGTQNQEKQQDNGEIEQEVPESPLDEAHIQSALGQDTSFSDPTGDNSTTAPTSLTNGALTHETVTRNGTHNGSAVSPSVALPNGTTSDHLQQPTQDSTETSSSKKRKATDKEDEAEQLSGILDIDRTLTKTLNALDEELDELDMRRQGLLNKRRMLENQRKDNRETFRRLSQNFA
jgi:hypothetical protein